MLLSALQSWLDGERDSTQGAQLYAQHPDARPALVRLLQRGAIGAVVQRQLVQEVEQLLAASPATEAATATAAPLLGAPTAPEQPATPGQPVEVDELVRRRTGLFKESSHLQSTLRHLPSDEARLEAALTILANFKQNGQDWDALKYHEQHGALPPQLPAEVVAALDGDRDGLIKKRNNLRTYISGKRGNEQKRALWLAELAEIERRLAQ